MKRQKQNPDSNPKKNKSEERDLLRGSFPGFLSGPPIQVPRMREQERKYMTTTTTKPKDALLSDVSRLLALRPDLAFDSPISSFQPSILHPLLDFRFRFIHSSCFSHDDFTFLREVFLFFSSALLAVCRRNFWATGQDFWFHSIGALVRDWGMKISTELSHLFCILGDRRGDIGVSAYSHLTCKSSRQFRQIQTTNEQ